MKNIVIICVIAVVCTILAGFTGYYIGSKSHSTSSKQAVNPLENSSTIDDKTLELIKNELRDEVKSEVRAEIYDEVYNQAMQDVESSINDQLNKLKTEQIDTTEQESTNTSIQNNNQPNATTTTTATTKTEPYIKVHDVSVSASNGNMAIESAINSAVDSSSGTAMCDTSAIVGIGTFPIYWTSSDGATATSYITITE